MILVDNESGGGPSCRICSAQRFTPLELRARRKFKRGYPRVELESSIGGVILVDIPERALIGSVNGQAAVVSPAIGPNLRPVAGEDRYR